MPRPWRGCWTAPSTTTRSSAGPARTTVCGLAFSAAMLHPRLLRRAPLVGYGLFGVGAYLESSKQSNVDYYARFGFRVTREVRLPRGPRMWLMWRDAH
jgi:hypothetical protein